MIDHADLLELAHRAVDLAVDVITKRGPGAVTVKGDRDMASEVDFAVEAELRQFLADASPTIAFLGEEQGQPNTSSEGLTWVLDPVDGTANFVRGIPLCGASLALVSAERPILGVIDLPFLGSRYSALDGQGATHNGDSISASTTAELAEAIVAIGDYAVGDNAVNRNAPRLALTAALAEHVQRVRMLGTASVDLAWVAHGRLDAALMMSNKPWDTAPGAVIAREAGALVLDLSGRPHSLASRSIIAVTPALAPALLELVQSVGAG